MKELMIEERPMVGFHLLKKLGRFSSYTQGGIWRLGRSLCKIETNPRIALKSFHLRFPGPWRWFGGESTVPACRCHHLTIGGSRDLDQEQKIR